MYDLFKNNVCLADFVSMEEAFLTQPILDY